MSVESRVLVVDDEPSVREIIRRGLGRHGFHCRAVADVATALAAAETEHFDLAISDIRMPGHDGTWLLEQYKKRWPDIAVIMLTAVSEAATAVECLRMGADDYLVKPVNLDELAIAARRAIERSQLIKENQALRKRVVDLEDRLAAGREYRAPSL